MILAAPAAFNRRLPRAGRGYNRPNPMLARMLGSATVAAALVAATPVLITLFLNPDARLSRELLPFALALFAPTWVLALALFVAVMLPVRRLSWWRQPRQSPLPALPGLTTMSFLAGAAASALYWQNVLCYRHSIPAGNLSALATAGVTVSVATLILLAVCIDVAFLPQMARIWAGPLTILAAAAIVVVPMAVRPRADEPKRGAAVVSPAVEPQLRVTLVGVDGLGYGFLREELSRGRLPQLAGLVRRGAFGPLATLRPTQAPPVWTTIVTGCLPRDHGVKGYAQYRFAGSDSIYELLPRGIFAGLLERVGLLSSEPVTRVTRRRQAIWNVLGAFGVDAGIVCLPVTHPVEPVRGFMLSNYFDVVPPARLQEAVYPGALLHEAAARIVRPEDIDPAWLSEFVAPDESGARGSGQRRQLVSQALARDLSALRAGRALRAALDPPFFAVHLRGFDVVAHEFTRFARPERFGDVSPEERRRYGRTLERYAAFVADTANEFAAAQRPREVLLVVSGFGMEPVSLAQRLRAWFGGGSTATGTHVDAPDGFVLALGSGVRAGARIDGASVLDMTPTMLYLVGLPLARDMQGRVLSEVLDDDAASAHPVTYIASYESLAVAPAPPPDVSDLPPLPDADQE